MQKGMLALATGMIVVGLVMMMNDAVPMPVLVVSGITVDSGTMGTWKYATIRNVSNIDRKLEALVKQFSVGSTQQPGAHWLDTHYNIPGLTVRVVPQNDTTYPLIAKYKFKRYNVRLTKREDRGKVLYYASLLSYGNTDYSKGLNSDYPGPETGRLQLFVSSG